MRHSRPPYVPSNARYVPLHRDTPIDPERVNRDSLLTMATRWFVVVPVLVVLVIALGLVISVMPPTGAGATPGATFHTPTTYGPPPTDLPVMGDGSGSCFDVVCTFRAPR